MITNGTLECNNGVWWLKVNGIEYSFASHVEHVLNNLLYEYYEVSIPVKISNIDDELNDYHWILRYVDVVQKIGKYDDINYELWISDGVCRYHNTVTFCEEGLSSLFPSTIIRFPKNIFVYVDYKAAEKKLEQQNKQLYYSCIES